ncbi:MAG: hypothetical protein HY907_06205 [Deltaproteobacteria bacterium]|nr:hypothetical protein [Deltaproteobacteria bacterium]
MSPTPWTCCFLLACCVLPACGDDSSPTDAAPDDATGDDAAVDDALDEDVAPDDAAGDDALDGEDAPDDAPPTDVYCLPCRWDADCGPTGTCALFDGLEMSCLPSCAGGLPCPDGSECTTRDGGEYCAPVAETCIVSGLGEPCRAWGCDGRFDTCSDPAGSTSGFCTRACSRDIDCDPGFNRCADRGDGVRACLEPLPPPPERCGANPPATGVGASCVGGASCTGGSDTCLRTVDARLPELCSKPCTAAADCPASSRCLPVAGTSPADLDRYCLPDDCICLQRVPGSMLDDALDALGLDRCDLFFSKDSMDRFGPELANDRFRLPWYDDIHGEWLRGEPFVRDLVGALDAATTPRGLLLRAAERQGHPILDRPHDPAVDPTDPLTEAIASLIDHHGGPADRDAIAAEAATLPAPLRSALAPVIVALDEAATARDVAIAPIAANDSLVARIRSDTPGLVLPSTSSLTVTRRDIQDFLIDDFGYATLFQAGADLLATVEAADLDRFLDDTGFSATWDTPLGIIAVRDGADDAHETADLSGDILLLVDTGGNDTYRVQAGATRSRNNPVSLAIDLGGADIYGYDERPRPADTPPRLPSDAQGRYPGDAYYGPFSLSTIGRQGSGSLGIGILLDHGDSGDEYRSLRMSQGWGSLGVGILYDAGGDDRYLCEAGCQGASTFGVGILLDAGEGIDHYEGYYGVQGFAYVLGAGILYDDGGDDTYLAQPDDVLYYNPQDPGRSNSSMSQGMGFGRRSDLGGGGDGVYMSGGLGVLRDLAGNDDYECAVFCEGSGYWFGTGILADGSGADHYDARWYVEGGAAHYAMAALWDAAGNDVYNATARRLNVTLGGGHDFSTAFLMDDAGDDSYGAPNLSLGAGNEDGFGWLADRAGVDSYECSSDFSFGNAQVDPASGARTLFPTMGLFFDADGDDTYTRPDTAVPADDSLWTQRVHDTDPIEEFEYGAGVDRTAGIVGL